MQYKFDDIISFIESFKTYESNDTLLNTFTQGYCYYFALILKHRFPKCILFYDTKDCHFLVSYKQKLYDIRGDVTLLYDNNDNLVEWEKIKQKSGQQYTNIVDNVIMKRIPFI